MQQLTCKMAWSYSLQSLLFSVVFLFLIFYPNEYLSRKVLGKMLCPPRLLQNELFEAPDLHQQLELIVLTISSLMGSWALFPSEGNSLGVQICICKKNENLSVIVLVTSVTLKVQESSENL